MFHAGLSLTSAIPCHGAQVLRNIILGAVMLLALCDDTRAQSWTGKASFYSTRGEMACAHRSLPFGTQIRVTTLSNSRSVVLVVSDRGPYIKGRIIDVSAKAANILGFRYKGLARVTVETIEH
jgi:rare lipoprotein A